MLEVGEGVGFDIDGVTESVGVIEIVGVPDTEIVGDADP